MNELLLEKKFKKISKNKDQNIIKVEIMKY